MLKGLSKRGSGVIEEKEGEVSPLFLFHPLIYSPLFTTLGIRFAPLMRQQEE